MGFFICVTNFSSLAWLEVSQEPIVLEIILEGFWKFLTEILENGDIHDIMDNHYTWFFTFVPNFSSLAWSEVCQESPILEVILAMTGVILDSMNHHYMWFFMCQISSLNHNQKCKKYPHPQNHTWSWRFLIGVLEDEVIHSIMEYQYMWLFTCLPNFSSQAWLEEYREPPNPRKSNLEDIDGSWLESWKMGSSLTS